MSVTAAGWGMVLCLTLLLASRLAFRGFVRKIRQNGCGLRRLQGLKFLIAGPQIISEAYSKADGKAFKIVTPGNDHLMITSSDLIQEVLDAPHDVLSLHAIAKEILQPKHTMHGFVWQDQRGVEGTGFVRALRSLLTSHLPPFKPELESIIRETLAHELGKQDVDGYANVQVFPMVQRVVTKVNCFVFFGKDLSTNDEFTTAALEFPRTVIIAAEAVRVTPACMRSFVSSLVTRRHRAAKLLSRHLAPIVVQRLALRAADRVQDNKPIDCMQWLIDTSPRKNPWSAARMIGEIMAVWFSSVHQLAMATTSAVEDLSLHNEYFQPLREEFCNFKAAGGADVDIERLPLLDSFVKESVRYSNTDAVSCRRKALRDHSLQDGSKLFKDDWVCIPQIAMMRDERNYSDPHRFDGFRFLRANEALGAGRDTRAVPERMPTKFTTAHMDWPIWGLGNTACPGRFYASLVMKLIILELFNNWDFHMPEKGAPRRIVWRSSLVPRSDTRVRFKLRKL